MNSRNHATFVRRLELTGSQRKPAAPAMAASGRTLTSDSILRGEREIGIEHHGALYRLKVTRQGKLILNK